MVPLAGLEPARYRYREILSLVRLPISPQRQTVYINPNLIVHRTNKFVNKKPSKIYYKSKTLPKFKKIQTLKK